MQSMKRHGGVSFALGESTSSTNCSYTIAPPLTPSRLVLLRHSLIIGHLGGTQDDERKRVLRLARENHGRKKLKTRAVQQYQIYTLIQNGEAGSTQYATTQHISKDRTSPRGKQDETSIGLTCREEHARRHQQPMTTKTPHYTTHGLATSIVKAG